MTELDYTILRSNDIVTYCLHSAPGVIANIVPRSNRVSIVFGILAKNHKILPCFVNPVVNFAGHELYPSWGWYSDHTYMEHHIPHNYNGWYDSKIRENEISPIDIILEEFSIIQEVYDQNTSGASCE